MAYLDQYTAFISLFVWHLRWSYFTEHGTIARGQFKFHHRLSLWGGIVEGHYIDSGSRWMDVGCPLTTNRTRFSPNAGWISAQRLRRWAGIQPALAQHPCDPSREMSLGLAVVHRRRRLLDYGRSVYTRRLSTKSHHINKDQCHFVDCDCWAEKFIVYAH